MSVFWPPLLRSENGCHCFKMPVSADPDVNTENRDLHNSLNDVYVCTEGQNIEKALFSVCVSRA